MNVAKVFPLAAALLMIGAPAIADPASPAPAASQAAPSQAASSQAASSQAAAPDVATLLFANPQWGKAPAGSTLTYVYSKKTTDPAFGPSFDDKIILTLDKGDDVASRTAEVKMFSGTNAKPAGPFVSTQQNPVLLLVFEENVQELSKVFKGSSRYLKNAIRKAWRDNAKIESVPIEVGGKSVPGTRITVQPFLNDAEKDKMMGLDSMVYVVEIADSVPGTIANIDIHGPATGKATFSETLHFVSEGTP